jgi:hypothetical protein
MRKKVPVVAVAEAEAAAQLEGLPEEVTLALADVAGTMREGLLAFASATGLAVTYQMMEAELSSRIGPKHAKLGPARAGNWHGTTEGPLFLGGRRHRRATPWTDNSGRGHQARHLEDLRR